MPVELGHEVTLFASGDSQTKARLVTSYDESPSMHIGLSLPDLHHALVCYEYAAEFDVINDHSGPLAAALGPVVKTPVCHTTHGPMTGEAGNVYALIGHICSSVGLISVPLFSTIFWMTEENSICSRRGRSRPCSNFMMYATPPLPDWLLTRITAS